MVMSSIQILNAAVSKVMFFLSVTTRKYYRFGPAEIRQVFIGFKVN